ncbi:MAG: 1,4-dihydroxy-6-naphthoate synthase [Gemmatimonadota bacterium]|nr:1,4-dihydroxy-6-naphthoate synthase [Gemmatimonadota bacterium]
MAILSLGYSPSPNDNYIFYGLAHGRISGAPAFETILDDIEVLNRLAIDGRLDVTKVSFHALGHLRDQYCLLHSGGALGRGCGPLVVAARSMRPSELTREKIAIPGRLTTACLLLRLFEPSLDNLVVLPYHRIMDAVRAGEAGAGLIIHESRFTYPDFGLREVIDLGEWWERTTGHPIPLGGILARRDLGADRIRRIDCAVRKSVEYAHTHAGPVRKELLRNAPEMDASVAQRFIDLYVNAYTLDYGPDGEAAIADIVTRAETAHIIPKSERPLFIEG